MRSISSGARIVGVVLLFISCCGT